MNTLATALAVLTAIVLACAWLFKRYRGTKVMANAYNAPNAGTNADGIKTMLADAAIARNVFVKFGSDEDHVAVTAAANDVPMGITLDSSSAAEEPIAVAVLGAAKGTQLVTAGAAIAVGAAVQATSNGKCITLAATGFRAGRALQAAQADGDIIEIAPCCPDNLAA